MRLLALGRETGERQATDLAVGGQLPDAVNGEAESEGDKAGVGLPV